MSTYNSYSEQKGWTVDFSCAEPDRLYFQAEFSGIDLKGKKILELGFGNGSFMAYARENGAEVFGIEIQPDNVVKARAAGYNAFETLDELQSNHPVSFDMAVAFDVFEHLSHDLIHTTLTSLHGLLKVGGVLILRTPNGQSPFGRRTQYGDATHLSVITPKKMEQICFGKGLEVIGVGNQARVFSPGGLHYALVKRLQFLARDFCNALISNIYGMGTTVLDENIVIRIRKTE
ncbi:MAG: class I SAM-dependent methyltransferase [Rhodospirillaceae bacterium]